VRIRRAGSVVNQRPRRGRYDSVAMTTTGRLTIRPFDPDDLDATGALLADRHRRHRVAEPLLDPAYEAPASARLEVEKLLALDGAAGWAADRGGAMVGYLIGTAKDEKMWGPNAWVEPAGHAATDGAVVRALYAEAGNAWAAEGRLNHHVLVPASDAALVDAWFSLDFGQQHLHAVREVPPAGFGVVPRSELIVREPRRDDLPAMAELALVLPRHMVGAPVFSRLPIQPIEEVLAELDEEWDDPAYTNFVAEHEGQVVGNAVAVDNKLSAMNSGLVGPASAGFLGYAAVLPEARGLGAGRALGEAVMAWSRDKGYGAVTTDWRSTNLEADRAWRGLGFRPTFRRLHRSIF
jgi:GNAT superfamily N-acetyltransferase